MYQILAVYCIVFAVSFFGVKLFREWSLKRNLLDIPNERSSHSVPTPRGGGLIICAVSMAVFFIYTLLTGVTGFYAAYFAGAMIIAIVSLIDDVRGLSPFVRIFFHALAAALAIWSLGGFASLWIPFYGEISTGIFGSPLAFLWIVWLINAYNFMDGIDGIAAIQSSTAGLGWLVAGNLLGTPEAGFLGGVLTSASVGFLLHNWQPAKIFMGDVGSAFLGYSFAVLPLLALPRTDSRTAASLIPWIAVFLVWFFVFDSVLTFFKRLWRGEKVWQAHREHIYQKLVISGLSHAKVSSLYGAASCLIVIVLLLALNFYWSFEKTVFSAVLLTTVLLVVFWQSAGAKKRNNFK